MKKLVITITLLVIISVGGWYGYAVWEEWRILEKISASDPEKKEFVEFLRRDKRELKKNLSKNDRITYTTDLGLQWYVLGEYNRAIHWWEKGLGLKRDNEIGWYNLGNAYRRLKNLQKAEESYLTSIEYAKLGELNGCLALGELYHNDYIEKRAEEPNIYLKCLEKSPDNRDLIARLAVYYRDQGDKNKAIQYFDELFRLEPTVEVSEELRNLRL